MVRAGESRKCPDDQRVSRMGVDRGLGLNTKLAVGLFGYTRRAHWVSARKGLTAARGFLVTPEMNRTDAPDGSGIVRQCSLLDDSENDEERSDDLFFSVIRQPRSQGCSASGIVENDTNLSLD